MALSETWTGGQEQTSKEVRKGHVHQRCGTRELGDGASKALRGISVAAATRTGCVCGGAGVGTEGWERGTRRAAAKSQAFLACRPRQELCCLYPEIEGRCEASAGADLPTPTNTHAVWEGVPRRTLGTPIGGPHHSPEGRSGPAIGVRVMKSGRMPEAKSLGWIQAPASSSPVQLPWEALH